MTHSNRYRTTKWHEHTIKKNVCLLHAIYRIFDVKGYLSMPAEPLHVSLPFREKLAKIRTQVRVAGLRKGQPWHTRTLGRPQGPGFGYLDEARASGATMEMLAVKGLC